MSASFLTRIMLLGTQSLLHMSCLHVRVMAGSAANGGESRAGPADPSVQRFGPGAATEQEPGSASGPAASALAVPPPPASRDADTVSGGGLGFHSGVPSGPQSQTGIPPAEPDLGAAGLRGDASFAAPGSNGPGQGQVPSSEEKVSAPPPSWHTLAVFGCKGPSCSARCSPLAFDRLLAYAHMYRGRESACNTCQQVRGSTPFLFPPFFFLSCSSFSQVPPENDMFADDMFGQSPGAGRQAVSPPLTLSVGSLHVGIDCLCGNLLSVLRLFVL